MRPSHKKPDDLAQRQALISAAISKAGPTWLAGELGVTSWSIYKWRNAGYVPNGNLAAFCRLTGESPAAVCDPTIRDLVKARAPNTTKSRGTVGKAAGQGSRR